MTPHRHLDWNGCFNVRDLGGLPAANGRVTRRGTVVRADAVDRLTESGWAALRAHGIRTIIDLRNDFELRRDAAVRPDSIETVRLPLDGVEDSVFWEAWTAEPPPLYYRAHLEHMPERSAAVLAAIAEAPPGGVLVHCVGGIDRTGLIAALLLVLAGVAPEDIADDHSLSTERVGPLYAALGLPERTEVDEALAERGTSGRESIIATLAAVDVEERLRAGGLDDRTLNSIRERLLGLPDGAMHFTAQAEIRETVASVVAEHRRRILERLPGAEIHHVGATAVPGALTKGDVDLAVRVEPEDLQPTQAELGRLYAIHQPENWTVTYTSFRDPRATDPPVGVQLVVRDSPDDLLFVVLRDLLRLDPGLLAAYNGFKREHEGATYEAYTEAKERFWEPVLARLRAQRPHS